MPTKRTKRTRNQRNRITPQAVEMFLAGDVAGLDRELGRIPFSDPSPIEAVTDEPPAWAHEGHAWRVGWAAARTLRAQLQQEASRHAE